MLFENHRPRQVPTLVGHVTLERPQVESSPALRSNRAPNTLGESGRGKLSHSIEPSGATRQLFSQSDRNA